MSSANDHRPLPATPGPASPWRRDGWFLALLVLGCLLRLHQVQRPFDERLANPWRQSDYYQIARNFDREGLDPRYPRIDWRGDGPGFAEMELPVLPWLGAVTHRGLGGERVRALRGWSAAFEVAGLLLFAALARRLLDPGAQRAALALFAVAPLSLELSGSLQPEPVVHALGLAAVLGLVHFAQSGRNRTLLVASLCLGLAIAAKLPAAHLGFVAAGVVLATLGSRALRDPWVWLASGLALAPGLAWSWWARGFWITYGNSLGVSNESHFLGLDILWPPRFLLGLAKREVLVAMTPLVVPLVAVACWVWLRRLMDRRRARTEGTPPPVAPAMLTFLVGWWGAAWIFYVLTARTSADGWAYYYHLYSVAPVCLLAGVGFETWRRRPGPVLVQRGAWLALLLAVGGSLTVAWQQIQRPSNDAYLSHLHACSRELAEHIPPDGRIVVRGGAMFDASGRPVAHNESMVFAWIDRKGFCYGDESLGFDTLDALVARGGRYWLVGAAELERVGLEGAVETRYHRLGTCRQSPIHLYDLASPGSSSSSSSTNSSTASPSSR